MSDAGGRGLPGRSAGATPPDARAGGPTPPGRSAGATLPDARAGSPTPRVSFVIPALDEAERLPGLLADLRSFPLAHEVIVADGGSADGTAARAAALGARVLAAPRGRGRQLRAGATAAGAPVLCFLHADMRLDAAALEALARAAAAGGAWALRLRIAAPGWRFRLVELGANLRARAGLPYGDQALLLPRALYQAAGGYPDVPLMEDVALVRALRRHGGVRLLSAAVAASPRRWCKDGVLRRTLRNWALVSAYLLGVPPERLARHYAPHSRSGARRTIS